MARTKQTATKSTGGMAPRKFLKKEKKEKKVYPDITTVVEMKEGIPHVFGKVVLPKNQHQLVFSLEKRNGKPVTIIGKFQIEDEKIKDILRLLKTKLACGGSIKDEYIEIQGDLKDKVRVILVDNGWKFKN